MAFSPEDLTTFIEPDSRNVDEQMDDYDIECSIEQLKQVLGERIAEKRLKGISLLYFSSLWSNVPLVARAKKHTAKNSQESPKEPQ